MSPRQLTWDLEGNAAARLDGVIDEFAELETLGSALTAPSITIDLAGVQRINSIGVRAWVKLMGQLAGKQVTLRRVPPVMIEQLNCIAGFAGKANVQTVLLPYACDKDGPFTVELTLRGKDSGGDIKPSQPCPACGGASEFDDIPDRYLSFTRY